MPKFEIDLTGAAIPMQDGAINEYTNKGDAQSAYFDVNRKVIFINGMNNTGEEHAKSALALSMVQMCAVIGVYNKTGGVISDLIQCLADKNQFNGVSLSAKNGVGFKQIFQPGQSKEALARQLLARNPATLALFDLLRKPENRNREIFAHSQGNLILSNALQAIVAVDGQQALNGRKVHTFGSPTVNWPQGLHPIEHGFTWDPVSWLAGFDTSFSISKVGMPSGALNPISHSFLLYIDNDPTFVVNRFRVGSLGVTFNMDEEGLAECLVAMGTNMKRVKSIFEHLNANHNSDADDVALLYVNQIRTTSRSAEIITALKKDTDLIKLLIRVMDEGWTSDDEKKAIAFLKTL